MPDRKNDGEKKAGTPHQLSEVVSADFAYQSNYGTGGTPNEGPTDVDLGPLVDAAVKKLRN